jgi:hypothetical protein
MMLFRKDLQRLANLRLRESRALLKVGLFDGAYHAAGLAVECGMKAIIAKKTRKHQFPDKKLATDCWTHNPEVLAKHADILAAIKKLQDGSEIFDSNWAQVSQWQVESRYAISVTEREARDFYAAVASK